MGKNAIMVSVYCLTYNHEKYIRDALEGFVNQKTNFKYEVFVHDDASTDNTAAIVKEYAERYPDIIKPIFQTENQYSKGVKIARNFIWPLMQGKYIAVCEGDDYWTDNYKLQKQVDFLEKNIEYMSCVHNTLRVNVQTNRKDLINASKQDYDVLFTEILKFRTYQTSSLMYRREAAEKQFSVDRPSFFDKAKVFGDYPLGVFLVLEGKMRYLSDVMSVYRAEVPNGWTNRVNNDKQYACVRFESGINMLEALEEYTCHQYTDEILAEIDKTKFDYLLYCKDFKKLKQEDKDWWKRRKGMRRVGLIVRVNAPWIYKIYQTCKKLFS